MDTTTTTTPIEISAEELAKLWGFSVHAAYVEWVAQEAALEAKFVAMFADPHTPRDSRMTWSNPKARKRAP